jgi:DNA invertase Pin-like site-specific DNA recombinase
VRVIGYTRVSTREQAEDGLSLATQRRAIEAECERRGWTPLEVIEDDGYTGRNDDRPGLQRVFTIMGKRNRPDALVVVRLDRLTRSLKGLVDLLDKADHRWGLIALDMDLNTTTANGQLVVHILGAVAHWESRMNSERTSAGMRAAHANARATGKVLGFQPATPPEVVRRIVRARNKGEPFNRIAARLDRQGIPTPNGGARWYPSTVARVYDRATKAAS